MKTDAEKYVAERFDNPRRNNAQDGWYVDGPRRFISTKEAEEEAAAEIEAAEDGISKMPEWAV